MSPAALLEWLDAPAFARWTLVRRGRVSLAAPLPVVMLVVFAAVTAAVFAFTETYTANGGVGDDGVFYYQWIRAYRGDVRDLGLNAYNSQRALGILVVRRFLDLAHAESTVPNVLRAFRILNATLVTGAATAWVLAARHFALSRAGFVLASLFAFATFATLRWLPWIPLLTDAQGFFLGAVALLLYLERRVLALAALTIAGAFMWPSFMMVGAVLLAFPRPPAEDEPPAADEPSRAGDAVAAAIAALVAWGASTTVEAHTQLRYHLLPPARSLFGLSCILVALVTFFALRPLVRPAVIALALRRWDARSMLSRGLAVVALVAVRQIGRWLVARPPVSPVMQPQAEDFETFLKQTLFTSVQRPLVYLVAHAAFFGLGALVVVVGWRRICLEARRFGPGLLAILGVTVFFALNSQSRFMLPLAPMVLPLAVFAFGDGDGRLSLRRYVQLLALALFASQFWYVIVQHPSLDLETVVAHTGPWMPNDALVVQGLASAAIIAWLLRVTRGEAGDARVSLRVR